MNEIGESLDAIPIETLTVRAFRAIDEPESAAEFIAQHRRVLEEFGITNVTTNTEEWMSDPDTYVIVAHSSIHGLVGGIRVEVDKGRRPLPIQTALVKLDPAIKASLSILRHQGNAEICGLWNANRYNSRGLPAMLAMAAVSIANQVGLRTVVCLVAHYTLRHALRVGFTIIDEVGDGGTFTYPIPSIKAIAMVVPDVTTLASAPPSSRKQLLSLRIRPDQERVEVLNGVPVRVSYRLCLDSNVSEHHPYSAIRSMYQGFAESA